MENANNEILNNQERYFFYIREHIEKIIIDYDIQYTEVKDERKIYPKFTKKQFIIICQAVYNRVYKPNTELLKDSIYTSRYNIPKVELCYKVFSMICSYYNIIFNIELFIIYSGIEKSLLVEWLNSGKSQLYKNIIADINSFDDFSMLNSDNSLLRVYYRNNREVQRIEAGSSEKLPDLSPFQLSVSDAQSKIELEAATIKAPEEITKKE